MDVKQATQARHPDRLISICIPTYRRPDLLTEALESCFAQTYLEFEVVIGDDSPDDASERVAVAYMDRYPDRILYSRHTPSLGQNGNVNDLFARARGARLLLLHDDDLLVPEALERLAELWEREPDLDAAFGKQYLMEHDGRLARPEQTDALNAGYHRLAANSGLQSIPVVAGLLRMFPNDGFMTTTKLAREIGYRSMEEIGHACDTDFGMRLCARASKVWFLDEFILKYRMSSESISKHSIVDPYTYEMLAGLKVPAAAEPILQGAMKEIAPGAVSGFARLGQSNKAWRLFTSASYPLRQRLSPRGLYHLLLILRSASQKA